MKLTQILITTLLMVSAVEVFATTEHQQTTPVAPVVTIPAEDQSAEATTVKSATSEVAVEEEIKEKATAQ